MKSTPKQNCQPPSLEKSVNQSRINNTSRVAEFLAQHLTATTVDLQINCNALHSPRRVFELRHDFGWQIETHWISANDSQGRPHRIGNYVLKKIGVMP